MTPGENGVLLKIWEDVKEILVKVSKLEEWKDSCKDKLEEHSELLEKQSKTIDWIKNKIYYGIGIIVGISLLINWIIKIIFNK